MCWESALFHRVLFQLFQMILSLIIAESRYFKVSPAGDCPAPYYNEGEVNVQNKVIDIIAGLNNVQEAPDIVLSSTPDAQNAFRKYRIL